MLLTARALEQIFARFLHIAAFGVFCPGLFFFTPSRPINGRIWMLPPTLILTPPLP